MILSLLPPLVAALFYFSAVLLRINSRRAPHVPLASTFLFAATTIGAFLSKNDAASISLLGALALLSMAADSLLLCDGAVFLQQKMFGSTDRFGVLAYSGDSSRETNRSALIAIRFAAVMLAAGNVLFAAVFTKALA